LSFKARKICVDLKAAIASKLAPTWGFVLGARSVSDTAHCRSRLAGDEARKICVDLKAAIASKLAPTRDLCWAREV